MSLVDACRLNSSPRSLVWRVVLVAALALPALVSPALAQTFDLTPLVLGVDPGNEVLTGVDYTYRISYRCNSTTTACEGVVLTMPVPPEVVFVSALGTLDVASITTPPPGSDVVFTFNGSVPAGNTGDLDVVVRFPNGSTADGTVATHLADATGTNVPPVMTPPVMVTARAVSNPTFSKRILGGKAILNEFTIYSITLEVPSGPGSLDLHVDQVVDTLPPGVVFNSAAGGVYDAMANTVTWDNGGAGFDLAVGEEITVTALVTFESTTFTDGQMVTNNVTADVTPVGEPFETLNFDLDHVVEFFVANPGISLEKRFDARYDRVAVGQVFLWAINFTNNGNVTLDTLTLTDTLPPEVATLRVSTGQYNNPPASVEVLFTTNLNATPQSLGVVSDNTNQFLPIPALAAGEYVDQVIWQYTDAPVGMVAVNVFTRPELEVQVIDPDNLGSPVTAGDTVQNCIEAAFSSGVNNGTAGPACHSFVLIEPFTRSSPEKNERTTGPYAPGDTVQFRLVPDNLLTASDPLPDLVVVDLLPATLELVPGSIVYDPRTSGLPPPAFEEIPNYGGTGRTLLRWRFTGNLDPDHEIFLTYDATVLTGSIAGSLLNVVGQTHNDPTLLVTCPMTVFSEAAPDVFDLDGDGDTTDVLCVSAEFFEIAAVAQLESEKLVLGQCDTDFSKFPDHGVTVPGGTIDYRVRVTNVGTVPTTNFVLVDILPFVGDTGVLDLNPRGTGWRPLLSAPIVPPPGAAVFYSTSGNPCRPEVGGPTMGCDPPNWSTVPPSPISDVASFKVEFGDLRLDPLDELLFELRLIAPADAPIAGNLVSPLPQEIAWNSFAFSTDRIDGGFLNAEPLKVGIVVKDPAPALLGDFVWVDSNGNGVQDDGATGLNGVSVSLVDPGTDGVPGTVDDAVLQTTITTDDSSGNPGWYNFSSLPAGTYAVCFAPPVGFDPVAPDQGADDALDSDVDPVTGCTPAVTLGATDVDVTLDLGLRVPTTAALGNYVWFDKNGNGVQDEPSNLGVNGVTVRLYLDDGDGVPEPGGDDGAPVGVTATADDGVGNPGFYLFTGLTPGAPYFVELVLPPVSTGFTVRDAATDGIDSDADLTTGTTPVVILAAGDFDDTLDAGLLFPVGPLSLGNLVWADDNNNGLYEPVAAGEVGLNGVRLNLYVDANADLLPQPNEFFTSTTTQTMAGQPGRYLFPDLPAGVFIVEVPVSSFQPGGPLAGLVSSTGNDPAPDPDDDVDNDDNGRSQGVLVLTSPVVLLIGLEPDLEDGDPFTNLTVDFGFVAGAPPGFDYGDAPDVLAGGEPGDYNTTALDGGPSHPILPGMPFLGDCVDADSGTLQDDPATADDLAPALGGVDLGTCVSGDDEDGVTFADLVLVPGASTTFDVRAATGAATCVLNAWVDWDQDGLFEAAEQVAADQPIAPGATATLNVSVPASAAPGRLWTRFRCSTFPGLGPVGTAADGEVEDYRLSVEGFDWGDAPDGYQTLAAANGPVHAVDAVSGFYLGTCIDTETDATTSVTATGDDATVGLSVVGGCLDDEDGVVFTSMPTAAQPASVDVTVSAPGLLDAWIDFGGDGSFATAGDQVFASQPLVAGVNNLGFTVPGGAVVGTTYARFRLSTAGGLAFFGPAADGEVEDYAILIGSSDLGDAPDSYRTLLGSGGPAHGVEPGATLYLGACVDSEANGQPSAAADGDDANAAGAPTGTVGTCTGSDDEDGVVFAGPLPACGSVDVTVTASEAGFLDAWIDFDGDGTFAAAADRVFNGRAVAAGANVLPVAVPCAAAQGASYARFRLSSAGGLAPGGLTADGEVEDYAVTVLGADWGDAPMPYPTILAGNGARHTVLLSGNPTLGAQVDTEVDGQPSAAHDGDDTAGVDDEDGVSFGGLLMPGADVTMTVTTGAAGGLVSVWIDWNRDGDWTDPGEQVVTDAVVGAATAQPFTVPVPFTATGTACIRARISTQAGLLPTGPAPDGEVEDHLVAIAGLDYGDAPAPYPTLLAADGARHVVTPAGNPTLGSRVDPEPNGQPDPNHAGDDAAGVDDEDGVSFPTPLLPGLGGSLTLTTGPTGGLVSAWIDWNADGDWSDPGEQVASDLLLGAGTAQNVAFTVPVTAVPGTTGARFRISSDGGLAPTGAAADGEVEDHPVTVTAEDPRLGLAKTVRDIVEDGPGFFLVTFDLRLENLGNVPLADVNVTLDLATAFGGAVSFAVAQTSSADLAVNPSFDGVSVLDLLASGNGLAVGELVMVELVLRVEPGANLGPYTCSSTARATTPTAVLVTDVSQDGEEPDADADGDPGNDSEPTVVLFEAVTVPPGPDIPTLGEWGFLAFVLLLAMAALGRLRAAREGARG